jgi:predicted Zn-dependent peptidase
MNPTFIETKTGFGFLGVGYHLGAMSEKPGYFGTQHLMEHLGCKPFDHLRCKMTRLGIDYNAYTSDNRIVFWFMGMEKNLRQIAPEIYESLWNPNWSLEAFEAEKSTVLQEYADAFNDQLSGFYYNTLRKHYNYYGPIGKKEDIERFSYQDSLDFAKQWLAVPDQVVQAGSTQFVNPRFPYGVPADEKFAKFKIEDLKFGHYPCELETVPKEGKTVVGLLLKNPMDAGLVQKLELAVDCLTKGLESPLYQEIREKRGLSYYSLGWAERMGNQSLCLFASSTTNDRATELRDVYRESFSGDFSKLVDRERFIDCFSSLQVSKEVSELLPHDGMGRVLLKDFNGYEGGVMDVTYEEVIDLLNTHLSMENMEEIEY